MYNQANIECVKSVLDKNISVLDKDFSVLDKKSKCWNTWFLIYYKNITGQKKLCPVMLKF